MIDLFHKKNLLIQKLLWLVFMLTANITYAGTNSGGGGVGYHCGDRVYLADTYTEIKTYWIGEVFKDASEYMIMYPSFKEFEYHFFNYARLSVEEKIFIHESLNNLSFDNTCPVEITNDDGIIELPYGCEKVQLASQRNGKVCYSQNLIDLMTPLEQHLLKIHEAYIYTYKKPGEITNKIREMLSSAVSVEKFRGLTSPTLLPFIEKDKKH